MSQNTYHIWARIALGKPVLARVTDASPPMHTQNYFTHDKTESDAK